MPDQLRRWLRQKPGRSDLPAWEGKEEGELNIRPGGYLQSVEEEDDRSTLQEGYAQETSEGILVREDGSSGQSG